MVIKVLAVMPTYYPEAGGGALASHLMVNLNSVRGCDLKNESNW